MALPSIGPYQIIRLLGQGATGDVYLAKDPRTSADVALKVLRRTSPQDLQRLLDEADAIRQLKHPNIVELYSVAEAVGDSEASHYLSMRYVPGPSLASATSLPIRAALLAIRDVATAMDYAHSAGVIHLDLKPSNILLDPDRGPQIVDFGLARRALAVSPDTITHSGSTVGTPGFLAPEQALGRTGQLSAATDVFAIGATLYYLVTGRVAFEAPSAAQSLAMTLHGEFPAPSKINPAIPREVEAIILKAMNMDPRRRFPTAADFAEEVRRYLDGEQVVSVYEVFANAVNDQQDQGWRVRRKVLFLFECGSIVDQWGSEQTALYEGLQISDSAEAEDHVRSARVDAVIASDSMPFDAARKLLNFVRTEQPEASRLYVYSNDPPLAVIEELVNDLGVNLLLDVRRNDNVLGRALDRIFRVGAADKTPAALRDEVNELRRQLRSVQESLFLKNRDLETKSRYLEEKVTEISRTRTALVNLSTELRQKNAEVEKAKKRIEELSITDELTNVLNRRGFFDSARRELKRADRSKNPLSVLMMDIDFFKKVNDTHGHAMGDTVLRAVAQVLKRSVRETDLIGRLGGEEFCALLPDTPSDSALIVAERIRANIQAAVIELPGGGTLPVTISLGATCALSVPVSEDPVSELVHKADVGLYKAKQSGRNRVVRNDSPSAGEGQEE